MLSSQIRRFIQSERDGLQSRLQALEELEQSLNNHDGPSDVRAFIDKSGAELNMNGIFVARDRTHIDNQLCVEHRVPDCTSNQVYRGLAGEKGPVPLRADPASNVHSLLSRSRARIDCISNGFFEPLGNLPIPMLEACYKNKGLVKVMFESTLNNATCLT